MQSFRVASFAYATVTQFSRTHDHNKQQQHAMTQEGERTNRIGRDDGDGRHEWRVKGNQQSNIVPLTSNSESGRGGECTRRRSNVRGEKRSRAPVEGVIITHGPVR
jgi:hypothetical protein